MTDMKPEEYERFLAAHRRLVERFQESRARAKSFPLSVRAAAFRRADARYKADRALLECGAYDRVMQD
jgi:hypothetical protein